MRWLVLVVLLFACGEGGGGGGKEDKKKDKEKDAKNLPVAKPAPTWCDGKKCPCKEGDEKATESYKSCELSTDLVVQGIPCSKARIEFWPDGKLKKCDLKSPVKVGEYECHVGVGIMYLHKDGKLKRCHVEGEYKVDGYVVSGVRFGRFDFETYANGKLREGELKAASKFGKQSCQAGKVGLYPDGKVYSCDTAEPIKVDDELTLPAGTPVVFGADGALTGFFPQNTVKYKGEEKKAGWAVCIVKDCNTWPNSPD
jgi:hypothetical protein